MTERSYVQARKTIAANLVAVHLRGYREGAYDALTAAAETFRQDMPQVAELLLEMRDALPVQPEGNDVGVRS